ncbi:MAG: hypothetical protein J0H27_11785 [Xanthomonadales bacterium]|nr:hypothetical protein [Xanthomonadales bacterium]ODU92521.1 MAG: hypothetical protein ABT18_12015 [Rhodanobacter sp. SCN 66-43]OJY86502.1 MAG: hypothetical protein BGP23_02560 [Xanthomonadales bacterium 66-474]
MSRFHFLRSILTACGLCGALLVATLPAVAQQYEPAYDAPQPDTDTAQSPGRVARLAYLSGQVQFAPAGDNDWGAVEINRPMVIGDRLLTGDDGRAVLELGDASVRIDNDSAFDFLNLDDNNVQIELSQGTLNLAVRQMNDGGNFEVDTPTVAFVASTPGVYRIDDNPGGTGSMVTVFRGSGTVYGENGASREVEEGTSYRFNDSTLASVDETGLPQPDDFDRFSETRDANYQRYTQQQQQYVPPDMIGGDDLYQYGQWNAVPEYGNVWYPTTVPSGWAPYRYGHWAWIDPWGWTWVDNQPWGFAPFHYGRWVYAGDRWGWMPGPVNVRPVYAPALVAFLGGSGLSVSVRVGGGGPVGWFPLGPRDVYVPWFHASQRYFTNVNVTNIRNVYVNKTVINNFYGDYRAGRVPPRGGRDYAYRSMPGAVTAVPRNVFTDARPVHPAVLRLNRTQLERTQVAMRPDANPGTASLGLKRPTTRPIAGREPFARPVVARHQPPPRPVDFATRQKVIDSQQGRPLTPIQMRDLRRTQPANETRDQRVKLVPALAGTPNGAVRRGPLPPRPAEPSARMAPTRSGPMQRPAEPSARRITPNEPPHQSTIHPIQVPARPVSPAPPRPNELPSARFAHPGEFRTLPRPTVIRPAGEAPAATQGRLPVVRPVERAPQPQDERAGQRQQQQANIEARQRVRQQQEQQQQAQQQRQLQEQAQQRMRAQQADQQRARQQQFQQQREAQMRNEQRAREQQMQQQQVQQQQRQQQEQVQQQRQMQMQDMQRAREQQMQQREAQMQQMRAQQAQRVPQQREAQRPAERYAPRPEPREPPPQKHPPESSGNPVR